MVLKTTRYLYLSNNKGYLEVTKELLYMGCKLPQDALQILLDLQKTARKK